MTDRADLVSAIQGATDGPGVARAVAALDDFDRGRQDMHRRDRETDLAGHHVTAALTPVLAFERMTSATDWLAAVDDAPRDYRTAMIAEASTWYRGLDPAVREDMPELTEQARGRSRVLASQYGEHAQAAQREFLSVVGYLSSKQGASGLPQIDQLIDPNNQPSATPYPTEVFENFAPEQNSYNTGVETPNHQGWSSEQAPMIQQIQQQNGSGSGFGSGPEKPDEHSTSFDTSNSYAEVPLGPPGTIPTGVPGQGPSAPSSPNPIAGQPQDASMPGQAGPASPAGPGAPEDDENKKEAARREGRNWPGTCAGCGHPEHDGKACKNEDCKGCSHSSTASLQSLGYTAPDHQGYRWVMASAGQPAVQAPYHEICASLHWPEETCSSGMAYTASVAVGYAMNRDDFARMAAAETVGIQEGRVAIAGARGRFSSLVQHHNRFVAAWKDSPQGEEDSAVLHGYMATVRPVLADAKAPPNFSERAAASGLPQIQEVVDPNNNPDPQGDQLNPGTMFPIEQAFGQQWTTGPNGAVPTGAPSAAPSATQKEASGMKGLPTGAARMFGRMDAMEGKRARHKTDWAYTPQAHGTYTRGWNETAGAMHGLLKKSPIGKDEYAEMTGRPDLHSHYMGIYSNARGLDSGEDNPFWDQADDASRNPRTAADTGTGTSAGAHCTSCGHPKPPAGEEGCDCPHDCTYPKQGSFQQLAALVLSPAMETEAGRAILRSYLASRRQASDEIRTVRGDPVREGDAIRYHQAPGGMLPPGDWRHGTATHIPGHDDLVMHDPTTDRHYNLRGHVIEHTGSRRTADTLTRPHQTTDDFNPPFNSPQTTPPDAGNGDYQAGMKDGQSDAQAGERPSFADNSSRVSPYVSGYAAGYSQAQQPTFGTTPDVPRSMGGDAQQAQNAEEAATAFQVAKASRRRTARGHGAPSDHEMPNHLVHEHGLDPGIFVKGVNPDAVHRVMHEEHSHIGFPHDHPHPSGAHAEDPDSWAFASLQKTAECIGCGHMSHLDQPCTSPGCTDRHLPGEMGGGSGSHAVPIPPSHEAVPGTYKIRMRRIWADDPEAGDYGHHGSRRQARDFSQSERESAESQGDTLPGTTKLPIKNRQDLENAEHLKGQVKGESPAKVDAYLESKKREFGRAAFRVSAAFLTREAVEEPDFAKGYKLARSYRRGRQIPAQGSAAYEAGLYAGITDNPAGQADWTRHHRRMAGRYAVLGARMEAHESFTRRFAGRQDDAVVRGIYLQAGTSVDLVTDGPGTSPDPTGSTPINGPGTPPPMGGRSDPAKSGGPPPYQGSEPAPQGPVVPDDAVGPSQEPPQPDGPLGQGFSGPGPGYGDGQNLAPGAPDKAAAPGYSDKPAYQGDPRGSDRTAAFRATVQANLLRIQAGKQGLPFARAS